MRVKLHANVYWPEDFTEDEDGGLVIELPEGAVIRRLETLDDGGWRVLWWERV